MIEFLKGFVVKRHSKGVVLLVDGVGYGVELPLGALCEQKVGDDEVTLWIHTRVREDQLKLFGFQSWEEKEAFEVLISLSKVGPKVALAVLSTMSLSMLKDCVEEKNIELLQLVPGVGRRTAEKMLVELDAKIDKITPIGGQSVMNHNLTNQKSIASMMNEGASRTKNPVVADVKSALYNLGFKEKDLSKVAALNDEVDGDFSTLLKVCLVELRGELTGIKVKEKISNTDENVLF